MVIYFHFAQPVEYTWKSPTYPFPDKTFCSSLYSGKRHGKGEGLILPVPGSNYSAAEQGFYIGGWKHNMRSSLFEDTSPPNDNNIIIVYCTTCPRVLVITISKAAFVRDSFRVIQH